MKATKGRDASQVESISGSSASEQSGSLTNDATGIRDEDLRKRIEEAAYYRAAKRGFSPGAELEDWVTAEAEILGQMESR